MPLYPGGEMAASGPSSAQAGGTGGTEVLVDFSDFPLDFLGRMLKLVTHVRPLPSVLQITA
jgi:hypothetical protein